MSLRLLLAGLLLWALPSLANEKEAETCIRTRIWDGYAEGWAVRTATRATLGACAAMRCIAARRVASSPPKR